jgi:co-chaperonin GroES (HSP10)
MRPLFNKIFVQIEKKFQDEIVTDSGITFYKDTSFNPEENSTVSGIVVGIPTVVDKNNVTPEFKHNVLVGDKLYFNFNVVMDNDNLIVHEGQEYWTVDYWNAIALVRDGQVIPVGDYILIDPVQEEITSSLLIIPDAYKKKEGNRGMVYASNSPELPAGTEVEYDKIGKFWNIIEGKRVYCMYISNIFFIYEKTS